MSPDYRSGPKEVAEIESVSGTINVRVVIHDCAKRIDIDAIKDKVQELVAKSEPVQVAGSAFDNRPYIVDIELRL